jgi:hypothetical protein
MLRSSFRQTVKPWVRVEKYAVPSGEKAQSTCNCRGQDTAHYAEQYLQARHGYEFLH